VQNQCVIENITLLQQDFKRQTSTKRDFTSAQSISQLSEDIEDENLSPRKKNPMQRMLFQDDQSLSKNSSYRPPLFPIDMNADNSEVTNATSRTKWMKGSCKQTKRHERTLKMKAKKIKKQTIKP
jgi:hypothetical protein